MKSLAVFFGVFALAFMLVGSVYAQGYGMGSGMMGGGYNYCPTCGAYQGGGMMGGGYGPGPGYGKGYGARPQSEACQAFLNDTQGLRRELHDKRFEYREAMRNPKTTPEILSSIDKQIIDLRDKIQAKNTQGCRW